MKQTEKSSGSDLFPVIEKPAEKSKSPLFDSALSRVKKNPLPDPVDQLRTAWKVFVRNWQQLTLLSLIPMFLTAVLAILLFFMGWITYVPFESIASHEQGYTIDLLGFVFLIAPSAFSNLPLAIILGLFFFLLGTIVYLLTSVAQIVVLKNDGKRKLFPSLIKETVPYLLKYFLFLVLYSLILLIGLVLLVVPGIIFMIWFGLGYLAVVFDDCGPIEALKKSKELVRDYWWAVLGRFVFWAVFSFLIGSLLLLIRAVSGSDYVAILSNLVSLVMSPLSVAYFAVVYQDIKTVKEK